MYKGHYILILLNNLIYISVLQFYIEHIFPNHYMSQYKFTYVTCPIRKIVYFNFHILLSAVLLKHSFIHSTIHSLYPLTHSYNHPFRNWLFKNKQNQLLVGMNGLNGGPPISARSFLLLRKMASIWWNRCLYTTLPRGYPQSKPCSILTLTTWIKQPSTNSRIQLCKKPLMTWRSNTRLFRVLLCERLI